MKREFLVITLILLLAVPAAAELVIMGGASSAGIYNDTWNSSDGGDIWAIVNPSSGWERRHGQGVVVTKNGSIVLMGGLDMVPGAKYLNDTWLSTDGGLTWTMMSAAAPWIGRYTFGAAITSNDTIIISGGMAGLTASLMYLNDTWATTDFGITWTMMNASAEWERRLGHSMISLPMEQQSWLRRWRPSTG